VVFWTENTKFRELPTEMDLSGRPIILHRPVFLKRKKKEREREHNISETEFMSSRKTVVTLMDLSR